LMQRPRHVLAGLPGRLRRERVFLLRALHFVLGMSVREGHDKVVVHVAVARQDATDLQGHARVADSWCNNMLLG